MNLTLEGTESFPRKESCSVLVLYEDAVTRQRGLEACDYLVRNFWTEVDFEFHWWRTDFLADRSLAATAAEKASSANVIFLCSTAKREPSATLKAWFESWIEGRLQHEGVLVNLLTADSPRQGLDAAERFLRDVTRRAELDYLGSFPQTSTGTSPASATSTEPSRRDQMSSMLDGLLSESPRPPHFGIND